MNNRSVFDALLFSGLLLSSSTALAAPGAMPAFPSDLEGLQAVVERLERLLPPGLPAPVGGLERERFSLQSLPSDEVDRSMHLADRASEIPDVLKGIWWMDGNPLPDELLSFADSPWDEERRQTSIRVYADGIWTWHPDLQGRALYEFVRRTELVYELQFDEALGFVTIVPVVTLAGQRVRIPEGLVRFTARLVEDGHWVRESYFFGRLSHSYSLRRVVDADGNREPAFADYLEQAPARSLLARPAS